MRLHLLRERRQFVCKSSFTISDWLARTLTTGHLDRSGMETQLATDSTLSGLDLLFKEQLVTDHGIVVKFSGVFSTVSGLREYVGSLHKFVSLGGNTSNTRTVRSHYKKEKGLLRLGAGAFYG